MDINEIAAERARLEADRVALKEREERVKRAEEEIRKLTSGSLSHYSTAWDIASVRGRYVVVLGGEYATAVMLAEELQAMLVALDNAEDRALSASHLRAMAGCQDKEGWPRTNAVPFTDDDIDDIF